MFKDLLKNQKRQKLLTPKAKAMNRRSNPMDADKVLKALNHEQLSARAEHVGRYRQLNFFGLCFCVSAVKEVLDV